MRTPSLKMEQKNKLRMTNKLVKTLDSPDNFDEQLM